MSSTVGDFCYRDQQNQKFGVLLEDYDYDIFSNLGSLEGSNRYVASMVVKTLSRWVINEIDMDFDYIALPYSYNSSHMLEKISQCNQLISSLSEEMELCIENGEVNKEAVSMAYTIWLFSNSNIFLLNNLEDEPLYAIVEMTNRTIDFLKDNEIRIFKEPLPHGDNRKFEDAVDAVKITGGGSIIYVIKPVERYLEGIDARTGLIKKVLLEQTYRYRNYDFDVYIYNPYYEEHCLIKSKDIPKKLIESVNKSAEVNI